MSELVRQARRYYERRKLWEEMNAYGRARAEELGLTQADVVPAVKQVRKQRRSRQQTRPPAR
jgi:hypothetical protein